MPPLHFLTSTLLVFLLLTLSHLPHTPVAAAVTAAAAIADPDPAGVSSLRYSSACLGRAGQLVCITERKYTVCQGDVVKWINDMADGMICVGGHFFMKPENVVVPVTPKV